MAAPKGHPRYGGRAAGTPNKMTMREMIRGAERADDGAAYFAQQMYLNPVTFMKLFSRVLASELAEIREE